MASHKVLVVGAGVSGSICAFWLAKHGFRVTVIERSKASQKLGQGIEIEQPALKVVQAMGILDRLKAVRTAEEGFVLEDAGYRSWAQLGIGGASVTGELELMRGDLTEVLYKIADESPNVTYHFETTIKTLSQDEDKVTVEMESRNDKTSRSDDFDLVIGADGARSRTRQLVMGSPEELDCYHPVGAFVAYFSVPKEKADWPNSRACHFPNARFAWLRPTRANSDQTSAYFTHIASSSDQPNLHEAIRSGDRVRQKAAMADLFADCGWEAPRMIEAMMKTDNFYADELEQVKLARPWSEGRVVLVGDSAWAPTPFTGQGNQLAIIGAWILAQELGRNPGNAQKAFGRYEQRLRRYVNDSQQVPLRGFAPRIAVPKTQLGIFAFRSLLLCISWIAQFVSWSRIGSLLPEGNSWEEGIDLEMTGSELKTPKD